MPANNGAQAEIEARESPHRDAAGSLAVVRPMRRSQVRDDARPRDTARGARAGGSTGARDRRDPPRGFRHPLGSVPIGSGTGFRPPVGSRARPRRPARTRGPRRRPGAAGDPRGGGARASGPFRFRRGGAARPSRARGPRPIGAPSRAPPRPPPPARPRRRRTDSRDTYMFASPLFWQIKCVARRRA